MTESERRDWLTRLQNNQLRALCYSAGIYAEMSKKTREEVITRLSTIKDIENPKEIV